MLAGAWSAGNNQRANAATMLTVQLHSSTAYLGDVRLLLCLLQGAPSLLDQAIDLCRRHITHEPAG
jgi:hypothetical protein